MPRAALAHRPNRPAPPDGRPTAARRGYGSRWQRYRALFLARPENVLCRVQGCNQIATVVDHKTPHRGDPGLFWDPANHQPLCKRHHDEKTARADGGFGRQPHP